MGDTVALQLPIRLVTEHMHVAVRPPHLEHTRIIDIVKDQEPRLAKAAVGEKVERIASRAPAILGLRQSSDEVIAKGDETLLNLSPALAARVARRIEPPNPRITILIPPRILARQSRFADAA